MKFMNYILLAAAISAQMIGAYRFLKKILSFRSYAYLFTLIPFWIFTLAAFPLFGITLSPIGTILAAVYILAGTTFFTFLVVRYAEKKQQS